VIRLLALRFSPTRLKKLRERAGMTRTDVAHAARRSEQSVWLWERGKVVPTTETLAHIAPLLDCRIDDFFEEDGTGA
jgi:DNA-binding XRE family transcriptional regulator